MTNRVVLNVEATNSTSEVIPPPRLRDISDISASLAEDGLEETLISDQVETKQEISLHEQGVKDDSYKNRLGMVLGNFPRALWHVGLVGTFGARKYSDDNWVRVSDGIDRYCDAGFRHFFKRKVGEEFDPETGHLHLAHEAWNKLVELEIYLRNQEPK